MKPVPRTYLLDIPLWRAQGPRGLGPASTRTGVREAQGQEPALGKGGQAGFVPSPGHPRQHPMVTFPKHHILPTHFPSQRGSQSHFSEKKRQRLGRDLSQVTWQWTKDSDSGHSGPQRATVEP